MAASHTFGILQAAFSLTFSPQTGVPLGFSHGSAMIIHLLPWFLRWTSQHSPPVLEGTVFAAELGFHSWKLVVIFSTAGDYPEKSWNMLKSMATLDMNLMKMLQMYIDVIWTGHNLTRIIHDNSIGFLARKVVHDPDKAGNYFMYNWFLSWRSQLGLMYNWVLSWRSHEGFRCWDNSQLTRHAVYQLMDVHGIGIP